jgi:hypothetical protein
MRTFLRSLILTAAIACCHPAPAAQCQVIDLAGTWRFALDRQDEGVQARWFGRSLPDKVTLPGSLPAQGIGDAPSLEIRWIGGINDPKWHEKPLYAPYARADNFKFPFWLQPEKYYAGPAWYQRDFEIPAEWEKKRVILTLERPHWRSQRVPGAPM